MRAPVIAFEVTADDLLDEVVATARRLGAQFPLAASKTHINTIPVGNQPEHPSDREIEKLTRAAIRWNAAIVATMLSPSRL